MYNIEKRKQAHFAVSTCLSILICLRNQDKHNKFSAFFPISIDRPWHTAIPGKCRYTHWEKKHNMNVIHMFTCHRNLVGPSRTVRRHNVVQFQLECFCNYAGPNQRKKYLKITNLFADCKRRTNERTCVCVCVQCANSEKKVVLSLILLTTRILF